MSSKEQQLKELEWKVKLMKEELAQLKKEVEFRREMLGFIPNKTTIALQKSMGLV